VSDFPADRVTVARIVRPRGRGGEVAAEILTDFPDRLTRLTSALLWDGKKDPRPAAIRKCWLSQSRGGQAIFHFAESNSISDAEKLVGLEIQIPLTDRAVLAAGNYYVNDLAGCEVFEMSGGTASKLGVVRDVQFSGEQTAGTSILIVDARNGELLIPLATEICKRIDTAARRIEVVLPEGLLNLNQTK
jgi:16S rRNA processing protein RimM